MQILKILPLCLLLFCSAHSQAERELWDSLQTKMAGGVKGSFKETKFVKEKKFVSEGRFEVSRENGVVFETEKPIKKMVNMSMDSLKTFFSGDFQELKKRFDLAYSFLSGGEWILRMEPKERVVKKEIEYVELRIAGGAIIKTCTIARPKERIVYEFSVP
jgi:hypothetical protein